MSRLFFALVPNNQTLTELNQTVQQLKPSDSEILVPDEILHLTLRYLGEVSDEALNTIRRSVDNINHSAFSLNIEKQQYWKKPSLSVLVPNEIPVELTELVEDLETICVSSGLHEESRAFRPHITVIKKSVNHQLEDKLKKVAWKVNDFVLLNSEQKAGKIKYTKIAQWSLY